MAFHEYPKLLYKGSLDKRVNSEEEEEAALENGWSLTPVAPEGSDEATAPADDAVESAPKKRGRKKKAD